MCLKGLLRYPELQVVGLVTQPDRPAERPLFTKINARIDEMESEFMAQMNKLLSVFGPQLELYDAFSDDEQAMRRPAIDTIENLEKLTSPTTWTSAKGEVKLKHLEVVQSKRIPWTAHMDSGNNLVYESKAPLDAKARSLQPPSRLRAHVSRPSHTMLGTV